MCVPVCRRRCWPLRLDSRALRGTLRRGTSSGCDCGQVQEAGLEHWLAGGGRDEGGTGVSRRSPECVLRGAVYVRMCVVCVYLRECWHVLDRSFAASPLHRPIHPSLHNARRRSGRPVFYRMGSAKDPDSSSFHARQTGKSGTGGSKTSKGSVAVMLLPLPLPGRLEIDHGNVGWAGRRLVLPPSSVSPFSHPATPKVWSLECRSVHISKRWNRGPSRPEDEPSTSLVAASRRDPVPFSSGFRTAGIDVRIRKKIRALGLSPTIHTLQVPQTPPSVRRAMTLCAPPCMSSARGCRLRRAAHHSGVLHPRRHCLQSGAVDLLVPRRRNGYIGVHWCIKDAMAVRHRPAGKDTTHRKSKQSRLICVNLVCWVNFEDELIRVHW
ncbi:hypothetical protein B0T18DRAFT_177725 [Schizothecium vesticola]|uniref:Uncharacterized protein n=1 Tax=Schizothecium vesticola TaxID=314040 RepID=A0AA40EPL7_9PEZI|nr:hypothetical protein B0T18DRAFT_177725 [Schizothecium vesticola]